MKKYLFGILCLMFALVMPSSVASFWHAVDAEDEIYYTVSFVTNCETTLDDELVVSGGTINQPNITKQNFTLVGWFTDNEFTIKFDFNSPIIDNTILYANWAENPKVVFDINGGDGQNYTRWTSELSGGNVATIDSANCKRDGYVFYCWNTKRDGSGENIFSSINISSNTTLYAKWQALSINVDVKNVKLQKFETRTPIRLSVDVYDGIEVNWKVVKNNIPISYEDTSSTFNYMPTMQGKYMVYAIILNKITNIYYFEVDYAKIVSIDVKCNKIEQNTYKFTANTNDQSDSTRVEWFKKIKGDDEEIWLGAGKEFIYKCTDDYYCLIYCRATETGCESNTVELSPPVNLTFLLPILIIAGIAVLLFVPITIRKINISRRDKRI